MTVLNDLLRHLFPRLQNREKLPLLPLDWTSDQGDIDAIHHQDIQLLKAHSVARTSQDAQRILKRHPELHVGQIIKQYKRKRVRQNRFLRAARRFKELLK